MKAYTYLLIDLATISVPFIFSFHPKLRFDKKWRSFFPACLLTALLFLIWDYFFTEWGVWGFNPDYLTGIYIANLPIEEVLFFICIPYACLFTHHCFQIFWPNVGKKLKVGPLILIAFSLLLGLFYFDRKYTASTFLSLAIVLGFIHFKWKRPFVGQLLFSYSILLIPFFIVNGILTGTGLDEPIVWYDNSENLNLRLLTIPFEDAFYGFLLILINYFLSDSIEKKGINNI